MANKSDLETEVKKIKKWAFETYTREELAEMYARMAVSAGDSAKELTIRKEQMALKDHRAEIKRQAISNRAKEAAYARHGKPGASRDKVQAIRDLWASGRYANRDLCAEQECAALEMSFSTVRKALRNTPKPA